MMGLWDGGDRKTLLPQSAHHSSSHTLASLLPQKAQIFPHYGSAKSHYVSAAAIVIETAVVTSADDQVTYRDVVNCRAAMYGERCRGTLPKTAFETIHILRAIAISTHIKGNFLMFCDQTACGEMAIFIATSFYSVYD